MTATILVVDDLEPNIKLLEAKLLSEYYTVLTANNGHKAIDILTKHKIDVILLDVMMPEIDGFETCKLIKSNPDTTHIPIIMVTALTDIEDRVKGLQAGADEFLTKPIDDVALLARVMSLSRMKIIIDELKLRNRTNEALGASLIELQDNFMGAKILLINDDIVQAKNVNKMLAEYSQHVRIITDPQNLDKQFNNYIPDIIIISCQLEEVDPLRIAMVLKNKESLKKTAFMMLAEEENVPMVIKAMELGVNDYFIYPVDKSELLARVRTQLRRKNYLDNLRKELDESINLSIKDGLTGVFNRRYFDLHAGQMINKAIDSCSSLSLLMIDIDHFKQVNDNYGHQAGDKLLKDFSSILKNTFRLTDLIARYGGEEFCILLYDSNISATNKIANILLKTVEEQEFILPNEQHILKKTISIGLGEYKTGESLQEFVEKVDKALYEAKNTGRNKIVVASEV